MSESTKSMARAGIGESAQAHKRPEMARRLPVVVVAGPTASGKSALAARLAHDFEGVVINADSMQVYRDLPVLTAQPGAAEMAAVPHRLYGFLALDDACTADRWALLARAEIDAAHQADKLPILCGGTGLYLRGLMQGFSPIPEIPPEVRQETRALLAEIGAAALHARLARHDPEIARRLHPNDPQRVARAWEVWRATGRPLSEWQKLPPTPVEGLRFLVFIVLPERAALYRRCDARFDAMLAQGALDEVARALALYPPERRQAGGAKALGFAELARCVGHSERLPEAAAAAQQATRNYAKRQGTWFRNQMADGNFITPDTEDMQFSESSYAGISQKIRDF
ncbi:MAG TPA: tRNA (adenosine(37)-N6)-dimethylallyltransferase MiaA, partial [Alphaproteobacteria bacterium]|nr:tRNA (adenosine(37)-N6)-dimethylallyltransferase MiaA [Alphaproteobacteria bacterium]